MNILERYFFGKLLVTTQEARDVLKKSEKKDASITIRIANPGDGVKGYSERLITVDFCVCAAEGFGLNTYYSKKVLIPNVAGIAEELIIPFIEAVLDKENILTVSNFMNANPCSEIGGSSHIFVVPNIYTMNNTIFTLPKNDFTYLPVIVSANSKAKVHNNEFVKKMEEIQKKLEEPKDQKKKRK